MLLLSWIAVPLVLLLAAIATLWWALRRHAARRAAPVPIEWALTAQPVFTREERRVHRLLREALPHHVVLSRLPLLRFCQPTDPEKRRDWDELLGDSQVAFAICSSNGRVLAAIDLDSEDAAPRHLLPLKQSALAACRVRYLRCTPDRLPTMAELQLLVPQHAHTPRGPQPAPAPRLPPARNPAAAARRAARAALWHDAALFQDSPFAPPGRRDADPAAQADTPRSLPPTRH